MEKIKFRLEIQGGGHVQSVFISEDTTPIESFSVTANANESGTKTLYNGNLSTLNRILVQTPKDLVRQSDSVPVTHTLTIKNKAGATILSEVVHGLFIIDFNDSDGSNLQSIDIDTNADFDTEILMVAWSF